MNLDLTYVGQESKAGGTDTEKQLAADGDTQRPVETGNPYIEVKGDARWQDVFQQEGDSHNVAGLKKEASRQHDKGSRCNGIEKKTTRAKKNTESDESEDKKRQETANGHAPHPIGDGGETIGEKNTKGKIKQIRIECVDITNLAYNWHALTSREADVIFVQEHKLTGRSLKKAKEELDKAGWTLMCGPCDTNTTKPNAGVGVLVRKGAGVTITKGKHMTKDYQTACDLGRAGK